MKECLHDPAQRESLEDNLLEITKIKLPAYSGGRVKEDDFSLSQNVLKRMKPLQVLLFVHWQEQKRILAIVYPITLDHPLAAKGIPSEYQYLLQRVSTKKDNQQVEVSSVKKLNLITTRKGMWFLYVPSLSWNLFAVENNGRTKIQESDTEEIIRLHSKYCANMYREPSENMPRVEEDEGIEQFLLDVYPNAKWKNYNNTEESSGVKGDSVSAIGKIKDVRVVSSDSSFGSSSDDDDEEEEEEGRHCCDEETDSQDLPKKKRQRVHRRVLEEDNMDDENDDERQHHFEEDDAIIYGSQ